MAAPKNNKFWKLRTTHGRDKLFSSPDVLWDACLEYFEAVTDTPLEEDSVNHYQGVASHEPISKMRAMSIWGLCNFLNITEPTWRNYKSDKDFFGIVTRVEQIMKAQKFEGAAAGLLNPNIITRDLGLRDTQEIDHTNSDGSLKQPITRIEIVPLVSSEDSADDDSTN